MMIRGGEFLAAAAFLALGTMACSGSLTPHETGTGGAPGAGGSTGAGGDLGFTGDGGSAGAGQAGAGGAAPTCSKSDAGGPEIPPEHRATAVACSPSTRAPAPPDGGAPSCTTDADCTGATGTLSLFSNCLHGQCSFDACLTDADCGSSAVCVCSSDYYGGNGAYHANVCVAAQCRVDSDCGANGYCTPTHGYCGTFTGFYCHGPADTCIDPARDCLGCNESACVYSPATGAFTCGAVMTCLG